MHENFGSRVSYTIKSIWAKFKLTLAFHVFSATIALSACTAHMNVLKNTKENKVRNIQPKH
jgi:hypothetical protein